jgi:hypothetical protein
MEVKIPAPGCEGSNKKMHFIGKVSEEYIESQLLDLLRKKNIDHTPICTTSGDDSNAGIQSNWYDIFCSIEDKNEISNLVELTLDDMCIELC